MGKTRPDYTPNKNSGVKVTITNADKLYIREHKRTQKVYTTYSGFRGQNGKSSIINGSQGSRRGIATRRRSDASAQYHAHGANEKFSDH